MTHPRPFRFGVMVPKAGSGAEFLDTARRAEELGYSTLFVPDHFVDHPLAPMPAMAAAAVATTTLRVGSLVLGNDYKHPVVVAHEAATLDLLSDGRLELGLGAGWMRADYEKAGMRYDPPGERVERLAESVAVLKGLFGDGPFSFSGRHYTVTELDGDPKPVQRPHPPIIIGGGRPKVLALAAREADIVGVNASLRGGAVDDEAAQSMSAAATDDKLQWIRDAAGARYERLEIQSMLSFVHETDDRAGFGQGLASAFGVEPDEALASPAVLVGTRSEMIDELEARRDRWDMSYVVVGMEFLDVCAPIVAELAGR